MKKLQSNCKNCGDALNLHKDNCESCGTFFREPSNNITIKDTTCYTGEEFYATGERDPFLPSASGSFSIALGMDNIAIGYNTKIN